MPGVLSWLDAPANGRGIRFAQPDGSWELWPYERLAALAFRYAYGLRAAGVRRGDGVALVGHSGPDFVAALFGALRAGAVATPIAPPMRFRDAAGYADQLRTILATARPVLLLARTQDAFAPDLGTPVVRYGELPEGPAHPMAPGEIALCQFTSGTTGRVRGVRVPYRALAANLDAIRRWLAMTPADPTASWLPVHHDMGLIGCLLAPVTTGTDLWLMPPEEFVRRPARYLACFGRDGARLTAMPGFGLEHIARRVRDEDLAGMDFSAWRAVIVGAERLVPEALHRFHARCAPYGLARRAIAPAYGLAEATLAVTGSPLDEEPAVHDGVVGCGRPLSGVDIAVLDEYGRPTGGVGEIAVGGASVPAGTIRTGDAGFLRDGQLYVLGRYGDSLKVRGTTVFAEDLDALVATQTGVSTGRIACLLGVDAGTDTAVLVTERVPGEARQRAGTLLRSRLPGARVDVADLPVGAVPRTSSGKPKRRALWQAYLAGELPLGGDQRGRVLAEHHAGERGGCA
ncbi:MAG TPA: AMP-binding protein [Rugosimonospora sp.]|nr:AMP-binding protein [Rugosimonospora sp.]